MAKTCKAMCKGCPWRKTSMAGWLGEASPEEFINCIDTEQKLPCHSSVNYDDENWLEKAMDDEVPHCLGAIIATKKLFKLPRDKEHARLVKEASSDDDDDDHMGIVEFYEHHHNAKVKSWKQ